MIPFDPTELGSGSVIGSKPDTDVELMAHVALTTLCEDHLAATAALPIALLPIQDQENPYGSSISRLCPNSRDLTSTPGRLHWPGTCSTYSTFSTTPSGQACSSVRV
jgi:hypothetical protein